MFLYYSFSDSSLIFEFIILPNELSNYFIKSPTKYKFFQVLIGLALDLSVKQAHFMALNFMLNVFVYFMKEIHVYYGRY